MHLDLNKVPAHVLRQLQDFLRKPRNKRAQRQRIKRELTNLDNMSITSLPPPPTTQRTGFGLPPPKRTY
jgi:hypothetical protein